MPLRSVLLPIGVGTTPQYPLGGGGAPPGLADVRTATPGGGGAKARKAPCDITGGGSDARIAPRPGGGGADDTSGGGRRCADATPTPGGGGGGGADASPDASAAVRVAHNSVAFAAVGAAWIAEAAALWFCRNDIEPVLPSTDAAGRRGWSP